MGRSETDALIFTEGGDDRGGYENRFCRENRWHHFRCQRNARRERKAHAEELVKALIAREAMTLQEADVA